MLSVLDDSEDDSDNKASNDETVGEEERKQEQLQNETDNCYGFAGSLHVVGHVLEGKTCGLCCKTDDIASNKEDCKSLAGNEGIAVGSQGGYDSAEAHVDGSREEDGGQVDLDGLAEAASNMSSVANHLENASDDKPAHLPRTGVD